MYNNRQYRVTYVGNSVAAGTIGGTAQIFSGAGTLHAIIIGTTTGTAFTVFDMVNPGNLTNTSTAVLLKASIAEGDYPLDIAIANGLYIKFGIQGTYTVAWTQ